MSSNYDLPTRITHQMREAGLSPDDRYVAGVSGGADSMVMLHVLVKILSFKVIAVHINYGKRGDDSDADESLVRSYCSENGISLKVFNATNELLDAAPGNFQDRAREIRRRYFLSVMDDERARAVFLAHHQDDQAETVVHKLLRGAAAENWVGLEVVSSPWIRPLLPFTKEELLEYAAEKNIPYRTDLSNLNSDYARNMLRNDVFPRLEKHFPGWRENIFRISGFGSVQRDLLDVVTDGVTKSDSGSGTDNQGFRGSKDIAGKHLLRDRWLALPDRLRIPVARHWIHRQTGYAEWSRGNVMRLADLEHVQTGDRVSITDHTSVLRDRDLFVISEGEKIGDDSQKPEKLSGIIDLDDLARTASSEASDNTIQIGGWVFSESRYRPEKKQEVLQLRWEGLDEKMTIRNWYEGDRIQPFGMSGFQSVADLLTNRKISSAQKKHTLVLVSFDGTVHAVIFPHPVKNGEIGTIAELTRCHSAGQRVLLIKKPDNIT